MKKNDHSKQNEEDHIINNKNNNESCLLELPSIFSVNIDDFGNKRPWRQSNQDITDYFNYGFNEDTWRVYSKQVNKMHKSMQIPAGQRGQNILLNTELPVDLGGFGPSISESFVLFELSKLFWENPERLWLSFRPGSENFYSSFESFINNSLLPINSDYPKGVLLEALEKENALLLNEEIKNLNLNSKNERGRKIYNNRGIRDGGKVIGTSRFQQLYKKN